MLLDRRLLDHLRQIACHPRGDHARDVGRVLGTRHQVIGIVQRDEALRMARGRKDARGVLDADDLVARRLHHQQRLAEVADLVFEPMRLGVLDERAADVEWPAGELDLGLAIGPDSLQRPTELMQHVGDVGRCGDRDHGLRFRNAIRGCEHGRSAERVADQDGWRFEGLAQIVGRPNEVVDVRRKVGIGEIAFGRPKAGEIESQHADSGRRQSTGDAPRRQAVLGTGEAVGEQRKRPDRAGWQVEPRRELLTIAARECGLHDRCRTHDLSSDAMA